MRRFEDPNEQHALDDGNSNDGLWAKLSPGYKVRRYLAQVAEKQAAEAKMREQEERKWKERSMKEKRMRSAFLEYTQAVHTKPELYALWLYTYINQDGEITHPYDYNMPNSQLWVPTMSNQSDELPSVPCGHGSNSLNILHLPDLAPIDTSGDVGHSTICTLQLDPDSQLGLKATTNHPYFVASYANITGLLVEEKGSFKPVHIRKQLEQLASNRPDRRLTAEDLPH